MKFHMVILRICLWINGRFYFTRGDTREPKHSLWNKDLENNQSMQKKNKDKFTSTHMLTQIVAFFLSFFFPGH